MKKNVLRILILSIWVSIVLLSGCQNVDIPSVELGAHAQIDWVNFIKLNGITYSCEFSYSGRELTEKDLDGQYDTVKFNVADNIFETNYKIKDGDAAFLDEGTPVYKVKGYSPEFRVATYFFNKLVLYEVDNNPKAKKGAELLDIQNKVAYIGINSEQDGKTELYSIKDPDKVVEMVKMLMEAPLEAGKEMLGCGERYFLSFHLTDGTAITRCYWIENHIFSHGLVLPEKFSQEIRAVISYQGSTFN